MSQFAHAEGLGKYILKKILFFSLAFLFLDIRGSLNKFPDFFCMGTFIDSTHMKL